MKISVLKLARDDLKEIRGYLSKYGEGPPEKFRKSFGKFSEHVADMPYMYSRYKHDPLYRTAVIAYDFLVFYQIDEKKDIVKIFRILYGKRNIEPLMS